MPEPASDASDERCPRCGGAFHCGMHDAAPCPCTTVKLDAATLAQLRARYVGCLCLACLAELGDLSASGATAASTGPVRAP